MIVHRRKMRETVGSLLRYLAAGSDSRSGQEVTYREAVEWLYSLQLYGIKLGLENMQRLCAALQIYLGPQPAERSKAAGDSPKISGLNRRFGAGEQAPVFIHVAGTNGKGSVCAMLDAICRRGGVRCGLYTSPHLVTFRERIRLDGEMIPAADVAAGLSRIRELVAAWDNPPTFFEVTTALALEWFQDQHAHVVILETGLGGRLDATNVVTPAVSVLTPIGLDHQQILGESLVQIAAEKCGIIKPEFRWFQRRKNRMRPQLFSRRRESTGQLAR
jgi:dihydrofolate synthase/folylpolyglutamate synthase